MPILCPHCSRNSIPEDLPRDGAATCPECGRLVELQEQNGEVAAAPVSEDPVHMKGFAALENAVRASANEPLPYERFSGQWALFILAFRSRTWIPISFFTTAGLLGGLFLFYVGWRIGPLAAFVLGSAGFAAALWTFTVAATASCRLIYLRSSNPHSAVGFFRSVRLLFEHRTGVLRRISIWIFTGWLGFWIFNFLVAGSSVVALAGTTGRTIMAGLMGVQVLMTLCGLVWIGLVTTALVALPVLSLPSLKNVTFVDAWRIWGPDSSARRPLMVMSGALAVIVLGGGALLRIGYRLVLEFNSLIAGETLQKILSASPLAALLDIPLAIEPSLALQTAGIVATVSLAAVTGLLLGITAHYWGTASRVLSCNPGFADWFDCKIEQRGGNGRNKNSRAEPDSRPNGVRR